MNRIYSVAVALALATAQPSSADTNHMDVNATSVAFTAISEGSPTSDPLPLYNQPFANGDELVFTPTAGFSAGSNSGGPANQTDGKLYVTIEAKAGISIDAIDFTESGLTVLDAPVGGDAFTSVLAFAEITILEISGAPVFTPASTHFYSFAPDSSFLHSADAVGPSFTTQWLGQLSVTLPNDVTKLLVAVDNHLYAATVGVGTDALIEKTGFNISVTPDGTLVPEPATPVLLCLGAIGGVAIRRRSS